MFSACFLICFLRRNPTLPVYFLYFCLFQLVKHDILRCEYINDRDMLNLFINRPMVCGLCGSARTYALLTVFIFVFFISIIRDSLFSLK